MNAVRWLLAIAYAGLWISAVGAHLLWGGTPPAATMWAAPAFLTAATLLVFTAVEPSERIQLLIVFAAGFAVEVLGVASGFPFGRYAYTPVLAPSLWGVPIVMAGAWVVLIAWVRQLRLPVVIGALAMTACDLVIDPLAIGPLNFWHWNSSGPYYGIPLINFAGWFAVSVLLLWALRRPAPRNLMAFMTGSTILLFFGFIGLAHYFFVPSSFAGLLCGAGYWRWRSSSVSTRI